MSKQVQGENALKGGSLGVFGIVFFVVAAAAPLAASVATAPVVFGFGGTGAPLAYLLVGVVLLLFSVGYAYMSGKVTSAAGLAAYVEAALGKKAASACAFVAVLSYGVFVMGLYGGFGFFASFALDSTLGISADWFVCATIAWLLVGFMGYRAVDLNMRVLGVLIALEIAVLFFFDVTTLAKGGAHGISLEGFDPSALSGGSGFGIALLFAAVAFLGFEATAIYGEEARSPRRTVAVATYGAVILITVFYALTMWSFGNAYGNDKVLDEAAANPGGFVLEVMPVYLGNWTVDVLTVLVLTSYFAALLALHNTLARYVMSLGRAGGLPAILGRTHLRFQSPSTASVAMSITTAVGVLAFAVGGADPFAQLFAWLSGLGTLGIFVLQGSATAAIIVHGRRSKDGNLWQTLIAPAAAFVGICVIVILALRNWSLLSGATGGLSSLLPWLIPAAAVCGVAMAIARADELGSLNPSAPAADDAPVAAPIYDK
jgi:amino acid transporter